MKNFIAGSRALGTGFGLILRSPRLLVLGALPALISTVLMLALLGVLLFSSADLVNWMTPFADGWPGWLGGSFRVALGFSLIGGAVLLGSVSFIAVTLLIGGPFYERIAEHTEQSLGLNTNSDGAGMARSLVRGIADTVKLVILTLFGSVVLFLLGFVPVLGQTVVPVLAVLFGGWVITLEMVGLVFQRRGLLLRDRRRAFRGQRGLAVGFGLPTYLLCLIPVAQLLAIPSAVVGGTLLAHRLLDD